MNLRKSFFVSSVIVLAIVVGAVFLQNGRVTYLIEINAIGLIAFGLILIYNLSGKPGEALSMLYDGLTKNFKVEKKGRYLSGKLLLQRAGRQMLIWGSAGFLASLITLFGNIENTEAIGISVALSLLIPWWILLFRILIHYPLLFAHELAFARASSELSMEKAKGNTRGARAIIAVIALVAIFPAMAFLLSLNGIVILQFFNAGSLLMVLVIPFASTAAGIGWRRTFQLFFEHQRRTAANDDRLSLRESVIGLMRRLTLETGALAVLVTQVIMLGNIMDPADVMMRQALSLSGFLYALILAGALFSGAGEGEKG
jgi:hypothetical protein